MIIRKLIQTSVILLSSSVSLFSIATPIENSELQTFRAKVKSSCEDCFEVEMTVSRFLNQSCHTEETVSQSKEVMINSPMYAFLLGLKSHGAYGNVYSTIIKSAENTVDCQDQFNWIKKTKDLSVYYLM